MLLIMLDIAELLSILARQKETIEILKKLATQETEALKNDDFDKITEITAQQEKYGREMAILEKNRRNVIAYYSRKTGQELIHLNDVFPYIEERERIRLKEIAFEIQFAYKELQEIHELNKLLLKQGLAFSKRVLSLLTGEDAGTYGKKGSIDTGSRGGIALDKSI